MANKRVTTTLTPKEQKALEIIQSSIPNAFGINSSSLTLKFLLNNYVQSYLHNGKNKEVLALLKKHNFKKLTKDPIQNIKFLLSISNEKELFNALNQFDNLQDLEEEIATKKQSITVLEDEINELNAKLDTLKHSSVNQNTTGSPIKIIKKSMALPKKHEITRVVLVNNKNIEEVVQTFDVSEPLKADTKAFNTLMNKISLEYNLTPMMSKKEYFEQVRNNELEELTVKTLEIPKFEEFKKENSAFMEKAQAILEKRKENKEQEEQDTLRIEDKLAKQKEMLEQIENSRLSSSVQQKEPKNIKNEVEFTLYLYEFNDETKTFNSEPNLDGAIDIDLSDVNLAVNELIEIVENHYEIIVFSEQSNLKEQILKAIDTENYVIQIDYGY